jgi:hypothetical protein
MTQQGEPIPRQLRGPVEGDAVTRSDSPLRAGSFLAEANVLQDARDTTGIDDDPRADIALQDAPDTACVDHACIDIVMRQTKKAASNDAAFF